MADLRSRFLEDYAGGLLNVARQELSSTGEVLAQDGFLNGQSLFVEDGRGVKSALRLGSNLAEVTDPTTETGVLNVRTADRTYAKIRDLKLFATAVASAQGALSESVSESFANLEGAFVTLETDIQIYKDQIDSSVEASNLRVDNLQTDYERVSETVNALNDTLSDRIVIRGSGTVNVNSESVGSPSSTFYDIGVGLPFSQESVAFSGLRLGSVSGQTVTSISSELDLDDPSSEKLVTERGIADALDSFSTTQAPIGSVVLWTTVVPPPGWQACNGEAILIGPLTGQPSPDLTSEAPAGLIYIIRIL